MLDRMTPEPLVATGPASPSTPPTSGSTCAPTSACRHGTASSCRSTCSCRATAAPAAGAGDPQHGPLPQGRLVRRLGPPSPPTSRARLRLLPPRCPRHRPLRRRPGRRVHGGRDAGRPRRRRVAGRPAVVHRRGRDVGPVLRRVHLDPGRRDAAAAPQGHRADPGDRRPLHGRRPLRRRRDDGQRAGPVRRQPGRDERAAGAAVGVGRGLAGSLAERLEATPVWLFQWARQQRDGPYWRQGSLAPDYGRIEAAVLHIGGWMDEYVDAAIRMQAQLRERRRPGGRSSARGSTGSRTTPTRARTSTGCARWSAGSTAGSRTSPTAPRSSLP